MPSAADHEATKGRSMTGVVQQQRLIGGRWPKSLLPGVDILPVVARTLCEQGRNSDPWAEPARGTASGSGSLAEAGRADRADARQ